MKLDVITEEVLTEGLWSEQYAAGAAMKKYPHKFIHFTNINKLGVNPKASHRDPQGIYFYPIRWLEDRMSYGGVIQYGVTMKYYYIVDIDLNAVGSVDLGRMSLARARAIATKNGWGDWFDKVYNNPEPYLKQGPMDPSLWKRKKAGAIFYATIDYLVNVRKEITWLKALSGVPLLYDPGHGIINANEKSQALVIDRKAIKVLEYGENRDQSQKSYDASAIKAIERLGGTHYYDNKRLNGTVHLDGAPVHLSFDLGNLKMIAEYFFKGKKGGETFKVGFEALERTEDEVADYLVYKINTLKGKAEIEGTEPSWSKEKIEAITKNIYGGTAKLQQLFTQDGSLHTSVMFDSSYMVQYNTFWFSEDTDGNLHVHIGFNVRDEPEKNGFEFDMKFKPTESVNVVIANFQKQFAKWILSRTDVKSKKKTANRERLSYGFKYGNYGPE